ncbi:uncharacterized protein LOC142354605 isoform X2 [Convolutriloba macropyga]
MQDMDFWSHSLVKTKLGILKSKIKKVDFIYNDFLPDGRLDPTPRGAHNRESMGQSEAEREKINYIPVPRRSKRLEDFLEKSNMRCVDERELKEGADETSNQKERKSDCEDQLNLNIDVAFSDTSSWDQAGFATIRQSTVLSNDLSGTIKSGYQPDNEEDYLTQYHDSSRVVTDLQNTNHNDFEEASADCTSRRRSPIIIPVETIPSGCDDAMHLTTPKAAPIKDALKSLSAGTRSSESRVKIGSVASDSWIQIKRIQSSLSKPVIVKGRQLKPVTCQICHCARNSLQSVKVPDWSFSSCCNQVIICDSCLKCDQCSVSFRGEFTGSVYVQKFRDGKIELRCRSCLPIKCDPCIVCHESTSINTVEPSFFVQFCSSPENETGKARPRKQRRHCKAANIIDSDMEKTTFSVHKSCLKCSNCARKFQDEQVCFLQWRDVPLKAGDSPNVLLYDAACRLERCDFCHWSPGTIKEAVGVNEKRIKVQACEDDLCQQRLQHFKALYSSNSHDSNSRFKKWVNSSVKSVENNRSFNLKRRQFIRRSHSLLVGSNEKKNKNSSTSCGKCTKEARMEIDVNETANSKSSEMSSDSKSIFRARLKSLTRLSISRSRN